MASNLVIYDASNFVYRGMRGKGDMNTTLSVFKEIVKSDDSTFKKRYDFKIGGVHYLMRHLLCDISYRSDAIVLFDSKSFRKDIYKQYKTGRKRDKFVEAQLDFLYKFLPQIGITCYKIDGYEADDIAYNICERYRNKYSSIYLRTSDKDWIHNVDDLGIVKFKSDSDESNNINHNNFSRGIYPGKYIHFNTISLYKALVGDSSDSIPPFRTNDGLTGKTIYQTIVGQLTKKYYEWDYRKTRSQSICNMIVGGYKSRFTKEDVNNLKRNVSLVFPKAIKDYDFSNIKHDTDLNKQLLYNFLFTIKDYKTLRSYSKSNGVFEPAVNDTLFDMAESIKNMTYGIEKNEPITYTPVSSTAVNIGCIDVY